MVLKTYHEGEYDFGIDANVVMALTGYEMDEAKALCDVHAKNDTGMYVQSSTSRLIPSFFQLTPHTFIPVPLPTDDDA
jgi:hypothetical protein